MINYQYSVSRKDIFGLDILERAILDLQNKIVDEKKAISRIGDILFSNATSLNVDADVANLCEFARRVGAELLSEEIRKMWYGNNCWLIGPRDSMTLEFKCEDHNSLNSELVAPDIRNAAMTLYFCVPLKMDFRYAALAEMLITYIIENNFWSYLETERVYYSKLRFSKTDL